MNILPNFLPLQDSPTGKLKAVTALVQATAYGDQAEVAWLRERNAPNHEFDYFGDSGDERHRGLVGQTHAHLV